MNRIRSERRGPVELLTLDRPKALNALDRATLEELLDCCERIGADTSVRAVVLTGNGRAFAAGADIAEMRGLDAQQAEGFSRLGHAAMDALESLAVPHDRGRARLCAGRRLRTRVWVRLDLRIRKGALRPTGGQARPDSGHGWYGASRAPRRFGLGEGTRVGGGSRSMRQPRFTSVSSIDCLRPTRCWNPRWTPLRRLPARGRSRLRLRSA